MSQVFPDTFTWSELLRGLSTPVVTGLFALAGALLAGWMSRRTTQDLLAGQAAREERKLEVEAKQKRGEILRTKAEDMLSMQQSILDACLSRSKSLVRLARAVRAGVEPGTDGTEAQPDPAIRMMSMASFYFPETSELCGKFVGIFHDLQLKQHDAVQRLRAEGPEGWFFGEYLSSDLERFKSLVATADEIEEKLQEAVHSTMP